MRTQTSTRRLLEPARDDGRATGRRMDRGWRTARRYRAAGGQPSRFSARARDRRAGRAAPLAVRAWFDTLAAAEHAESDGTLAAAKNSARAYRARAKADNTRAAYRSAVRAWCIWCDRHGCTPLPASSSDVAAFIANERDDGRGSSTIKVRLAALRYLHREPDFPRPPRPPRCRKPWWESGGTHPIRPRSARRR